MSRLCHISHLVMVVKDVVGRYCRSDDGRVGRACCDRHAKAADHLHRQVSRGDRLSRNNDVTSPQDTIPLLRYDLGYRERESERDVEDDILLSKTSN